MLWLLLVGCATVSPPEPPVAPGWLVLRVAQEGSLPETPAHEVAPLIVPVGVGLESAAPGDRYTLWSEYGQLPATVMEQLEWPCGAGGAAVAVMARGRLPAEGPLWLTPGPPEPGVHALRPFDGHLGNVSVRAEERLVVSMGDEVFHDAPLDEPHEPRLGWLRSDQTALLLLRRETPEAVVYRPLDLRRNGAVVYRDIVVPRCRG